MFPNCAKISDPGTVAVEPVLELRMKTLFKVASPTFVMVVQTFTFTVTTGE
jgi:hypothetical protein